MEKKIAGRVRGNQRKLVSQKAKVRTIFRIRD